MSWPASRGSHRRTSLTGLAVCARAPARFIQFFSPGVGFFSPLGSAVWRVGVAILLFHRTRDGRGHSGTSDHMRTSDGSNPWIALVIHWSIHWSIPRASIRYHVRAALRGRWLSIPSHCDSTRISVISPWCILRVPPRPRHRPHPPTLQPSAQTRSPPQHTPCSSACTPTFLSSGSAAIIGGTIAGSIVPARACSCARALTAYVAEVSPG